MENLTIVVLRNGVNLIGQVRTIMSEPKKKKDEPTPIGYLLKDAFAIAYSLNDEGQIVVNLTNFVPAGRGHDYAFRAEEILTSQEPMDEVSDLYEEFLSTTVYPTLITEAGSETNIPISPIQPKGDGKVILNEPDFDEDEDEVVEPDFDEDEDEGYFTEPYPLALEYLAPEYEVSDDDEDDE